MVTVSIIYLVGSSVQEETLAVPSTRPIEEEPSASPSTRPIQEEPSASPSTTPVSSFSIVLS